MNLRFFLIATASAVAFYAGWTVRDWKADAAASKVETQIAKKEQARSEGASQAVAKADAEDRQVVVRYVTRVRYIRDDAAQLKGEIRDAEKQADAAGLPRAGLSGEWVRLYNAALHPGGGADSPAGGTAGSPGGAGAAEPRADEWDVLSVHSENASRWAECRAQLNSLIDSVGGSQTGVVTR